MSEETKPASWRINSWLAALSDPPPSRGSFYNWVSEGLIEISKVGDMTFILTSPQEFLERIRVKRGAQPEPVETPHVEPEHGPEKRGRGRPRGSKNQLGHRAGRRPAATLPSPDPLRLAAAAE